MMLVVPRRAAAFKLKNRFIKIGPEIGIGKDQFGLKMFASKDTMKNKKFLIGTAGKSTMY